MRGGERASVTSHCPIWPKPHHLLFFLFLSPELTASKAQKCSPDPSSYTRVGQRCLKCSLCALIAKMALMDPGQFGQDYHQWPPMILIWPALWKNGTPKGLGPAVVAAPGQPDTRCCRVPALWLLQWHEAVRRVKYDAPFLPPPPRCPAVTATDPSKKEGLTFLQLLATLVCVVRYQGVRF